MEWMERWREAKTGRTLFWIQKEPADSSLYRGVARATATFASRARIGHIVTNHYLYRFNMRDSPRCGVCQGEDETLEHVLLKCPSQNPARGSLIALMGRDGSLDDVLSSRSHWALAVAV